MGNTRNTGYLQNIVQYDASNNITLPARLAVTGTVSVNNTTPYDTTQFSLDVNGGLIIKNINKTAQFVLINSNPATGGNNAFVVHTVGGTSAASYADIQGYYGTSIIGSTVIRLNPQGGNVLVGSLAGTGSRMVVASSTGVLSTQAIVTLGDLSGVPTLRTITINGTTQDLSADRTFTINSMVYPGAGIAVSTGTAWGTSLTDNSSNWNTAFGWGNHASAGYLTTSTASTTYLPLSGGTLTGVLNLNNATSNRINFGTNGVATPTFTTYSNGVKIILYDSLGESALGYTIGIDAGTLFNTLPAADAGMFFKWYGGTTVAASLGGTGVFTAASLVKLGGTSSQFLKADGSVDANTYLTSITSGNVTTALGFTPYNATNPTGYITSAALSTYATESYVGTQIANLVASSPAALDTLNELAAALGNDAAFSTTVSTALGNRLRVDINTQGLSATLQGYGRTNLGLGTAATSNTGDFVAYRTFGTAANNNTGDFAAASHTHSIANVTGLQTALDGKQASGSYAASVHSHIISDVTGLQTALDGKQASLGFTPYNSTNPSGYITSSGSISGNAATATTATNALEMANNGNSISGMGSISNWDSRPGVGFAGYGINNHTGVTLSGYGGYGGVRLYASGYPTHASSVLRLEASDSVKTFGGLYSDGNPVLVQNTSISYSFGLNDTKLYLRANGDNNHYLWNNTSDFEEMVYYNGTGFKVTSSTGVANCLFESALSSGMLFIGSVDAGRTYIGDASRSGIAIGGTAYPQLMLNAVGGGNTTHGANISMTGLKSAGGYRRWVMGIPNLDPTTFSLGWADDQPNPHYGVGVGWGASSAKFSWDTSGNFIASGDITAYGTPSDLRLKDLKGKVSNALSSIIKLNGYRFDWKEDKSKLFVLKEDIGVIAQEVADVFPELARTNENGFMSVRYQGLTAVLIEAIKEQQIQIESQKSEIDELKDLVKQLINR